MTIQVEAAYADSMAPGEIDAVVPALSSGRWVSVAVNTVIVVAVILAALGALGRESRHSAQTAATSNSASATDSPAQLAGRTE